MRRTINDDENKVKLVFISHFNEYENGKERDLYYAYDTTENKKVAELLVKDVGEGCLILGDIDCCDFETGETFYNMGFGTKILNILRKHYKYILGSAAMDSVGFWASQKVRYISNGDFILVSSDK